MIFSKKDNITIITQENATIIELVANLNKKYDDISKDNIIVNLFIFCKEFRVECN